MKRFRDEQLIDAVQEHARAFDCMLDSGLVVDVPPLPRRCKRRRLKRSIVARKLFCVAQELSLVAHRLETLAWEL